MQIDADDLFTVVFNTLDFCGNVMRAAKEHCIDSGCEFGVREEGIVFDAVQAYKSEMDSAMGDM